MAFRELTMIDVKEVLRRWSAGHSDRKIAREASVDRKTAARYTAVAATLFARGRELADDEVHEVAQRVQARPVPATSTEWNEVARHRPLIERWLAGDIDVEPFVSHHLALDEVNRGFELMEAQDGIRSVIDFG